MKLLTYDQKGILVFICVLVATPNAVAAPRRGPTNNMQQKMHITQKDVNRAMRAPMEFRADTKSAETRSVDLSADLLDGLDLKETFETIINTAKEHGTVDKLPRSIFVCHEQLCQGNTKLPVDAFESAASYIVDRIATDVRSVGSGCTGTRGNLLDGRRFQSPSLGLDCDNFQISRLLCCFKRILCTLRVSVEKLEDHITECCKELKQDFRQTWDRLEEIDIDLNDCCSTLKTDVREIKADVRECCDEVKQDFRQTRDILEELSTDLNDCCSTLKTDIHECCEEVKQDFRQTRELLEEIDMDLNDCCSTLKSDLNECCEELKQDFRQTWELLEEIDMDLQDCCCELKTDIHECCDELKEDFRQTWEKLGNNDCAVPVCLKSCLSSLQHS